MRRFGLRLYNEHGGERGEMGAVMKEQGPFLRFTEHTMTDPNTFRAQLEVIRTEDTR